MRTYLRDKTKGGCYFFTINLKDRKSNLLTKHIEEFRQAFRKIKQSQPFELNACVVLPDHIHMIITLPVDIDNYSSIIAGLKGNFSRQIPKTTKECISQSRAIKKERGIWQRRFWEHRIRDDLDFRCHVDYIHFNPVKHGYVSNPADWEYSTIHQFIKNEDYPVDWGCSGMIDSLDMDYD